MRQQWVGVNRVHVFLVTGEQEQAVAVQTGCQIFTDKLDVILLMSVNPGFGGQSFIPHTLDKLREVRRRIDESGYDIRLEVDGGVKVNNISEIAAAGADMFVAGSAIFDQPDYKKVIDEMRSELAKVSHG